MIESIVRTRFSYWLIIALILAASAALRQTDPSILERTRLLGFDTLQTLMPRVADPSYPVRIADIDEVSLAEIGPWPWRRDTIATLAERLLKRGARVVVFDVVFPASPSDALDGIPQQLRIDPVLKPLMDKLTVLPSPDERLAEAIRGQPVVLGFIAKSGSLDIASGPHASFSTIGDVTGFVPGYSGATGNGRVLEDAARGVGSMNWFPEQDQILRRVPMLVRIGDDLHPSLAAETLRLYTETKTISVRSASSAGGIESVRIGDIIVPTDSRGQMWMHFTPRDPMRTISAADILRDRVRDSEINGRIVVVGTSAPGLLDLRATPLDPVIAGVEINVQAIEQLLSHRFLVRPDYAKGLEIVIALLISATLALFVLRSSAVLAATVGGLTVVILLAGAWIAYAKFLVLFDAAYPIVTATATYIFGTGWLYYETESERNRNRKALALISKEMESAAEIQRSFLPKEELPGPQPHNVSISAIMNPAKRVGGDFYDYFMIDKNRLGFAVGDVSGKGVPAALFMCVSRTVLRTIAFAGGSPGDVLTSVNDILARDNDEGMFVTLFYGIIDLETGAVTFSSGGHDDAHLLRTAGESESLRFMGPAIGLIAGLRFETAQRELAPGDVMFLLTDGITEAFNAKGQQFGNERLRAVFATRTGVSAKVLVEDLVREVERFAKGTEQSDDITCIAIQFQGGGLSR